MTKHNDWSPKNIICDGFPLSSVMAISKLWLWCWFCKHIFRNVILCTIQCLISMWQYSIVDQTFSICLTRNKLNEGKMQIRERENKDIKNGRLTTKNKQHNTQERWTWTNTKERRSDQRSNKEKSPLIGSAQSSCQSSPQKSLWHRERLKWLWTARIPYPPLFSEQTRVSLVSEQYHKAQSCEV